MKKLIYITSTTLLIAIFSLNSMSQSWTWYQDQLSIPKMGLSAAIMDDTIFYSAGKTTYGAFTNIWDIYDIGDNAWSTYETSSSPRFMYATVSAGGKVFGAGGSNYPAGGNFPDVDIYDKETGEWTVDSLTQGRTITGGAVACGNLVFFAGGHIHIGSGPMDYAKVIDIYDTETESWFVDSLSIGRCFIGAVAASGKVYFAGGATGEQAVTNRIDIYNMETGEWTIDSLSEAKGLVAAVAYGDKIYFAGGAKPYAATTTLIEVYNITTGSWEGSMNLQASRIVTALKVKNSLVFTGAADWMNFTGVGYIGPPNGVVEIYYPETNQWDYLGPNLNPERYTYAWASYANRAYYAGGFTGSAIVNTVSILEDESYCLPDGITFSTQAQIDSFQINYPGCTKIEGGALIGGSVWGNDISNLNGLNLLTSIGGLTITFTQITNFSGLENLTEIDGGLNLFANPNLTSFNGLEQLISMEDDLIIGTTYFGGGSLQNMDGLNNLNYIGGHLSIVNNDSLSNLLGLENLTSIGEGITIQGNWNLLSLSGLDNLESIGGPLSILANDSLTNISGLENIEALSITDLNINNNSSLSTCHIQSICNYLAAPGGIVNINDNAPGCNSQTEVEEACWTSIDEPVGVDTFTISPNPLESISLIRYTIQTKSHVSIKILDLTGQEIETLVDNLDQQGEHQILFNTSGLPPGVYFCVLKTNEGMITIKIIKL